MESQPQSTASSESTSRLRVRNPDLSFPADLPRHWFGGIALATHLTNAVNLLFPAGERFFVRSVRHFMDRIEDDPALQRDVKAFFGQEGRHAQMHERFFAALEAQGFEIQPFLAKYDHLAWSVIEPRTSPELRLSITVALEHFTAILAETALKDRFLDLAHPAVRDLLFWHAAEEIEHRAVAFDVLRKVNPSYALRMSGLALATLGLAGFWAAALIMLLKQDGLWGSDRVRAENVQMRRERPSLAKSVFYRGIKAYVARDFHPLNSRIDDLAADYLAAAGLT